MEIAVPFAITILVLIAIKFTRSMDPRAFGIFVVAATLGMGLSFGLDAFNFNAYDRELWNGEISRKYNRQENCPIGWVRYQDSFCSEYSTRSVQDGEICTTDKDGRRSCSPTYTTEYNYDYSWEGRWYIVAENIKEAWEVKRVDNQGAIMPKVYRQTKVGDPASSEKTYHNWILAASDSLFHEDGEIEAKYKDVIPPYPNNIYGIFKVDRIVPVGVHLPNLPDLNRQLSEALKQLGPKKQMNAIIVVADASKIGADFMYAVRRNWKGFKKNDAVTFIGVRNGNIEWADSLSWSKASIYDVEVRQKILEGRGKPLDMKAVIGHISNIGMARYERRSMKEFEYLKEQIPTSMFVIVINIFIMFAVVIAALVFTRKENFYVTR